MKILHILDHSIPLHSGYTFRTRAILDQQRKMGWETVHINSTKHVAESPDKEMVVADQGYSIRKTADVDRHGSASRNSNNRSDRCAVLMERIRLYEPCAAYPR